MDSSAGFGDNNACVIITKNVRKILYHMVKPWNEAFNTFLPTQFVIWHPFQSPLPQLVMALLSLDRAIQITHIEELLVCKMLQIILPSNLLPMSIYPC